MIVKMQLCIFCASILFPQNLYGLTIYTFMIVEFYKLTANLDNEQQAIIPYEHQYFIHAYIMSELKLINPKLASELYHSKIPYFVMSQLIPSGTAKFVKEGFYARKLVLLINSANKNLLEFIERIMDIGRIINIGKIQLKVFSSYVTKPEISSYLPEFTSKSPIILKRDDRYIGYGDEKFEEILKSSIEIKMNKILGKKIEIRAFMLTYGKRKLSHIHNSPITSSIIKFIIDTDADVIKSMLCFGIGKSTQLGYGMVDIND